jgi:manganese transport protein
VRKKSFREPIPHGKFQEITNDIPSPHKRIAICIDFSKTDHHSISHALSQGGKEADYLLIHIVESAGAMMLGKGHS